MSSNIKQHSQPHPRKLIRDKVTNLMKFYVDIDERVFNSRPNPIWLQEVPVMLVYYVDEEADSQDRRPPIYKRELDIVCEVLQRQVNNVDEYLDSRAFEIEYAMEAYDFLDLIFVERVDLIRTQPTTINASGNEFIESVKVYHKITYKWIPEVVVDIKEFLKFENKIRTTEGAEATDLVTIRQE